VSVLPPRFWRQQIVWSYCAANGTFGIVAWRNSNKSVKIVMQLACCGYASHLVCHCFSVRLSPCRLPFSFFTSFKTFQSLRLGVRFRASVWVDVIWNMHDFYWCGVKQESDCLHHGSGGVGLDADSKFTKPDRIGLKKSRVSQPLLCTRKKIIPWSVRIFCEWSHKWRTFRPPWLTLPGPGHQTLGGSISR